MHTFVEVVGVLGVVFWFYVAVVFVGYCCYTRYSGEHRDNIRKKGFSTPPEKK